MAGVDFNVKKGLVVGSGDVTTPVAGTIGKLFNTSTNVQLATGSTSLTVGGSGTTSTFAGILSVTGRQTISTTSTTASALDVTYNNSASLLPGVNITANNNAAAVTITQNGTGSKSLALLIQDGSANPDTTAVAVDDLGRLIVGLNAAFDPETAPVTTGGITTTQNQFQRSSLGIGGRFQVQGTGADASGFMISRFSADAGGPNIILAKSYGNAVSTYDEVVSGVSLGTISFEAATATLSSAPDSSYFNRSAYIRVESTAAHTATSAPAMMMFAVTKPNEIQPTDALTINSDLSILAAGNLTVQGNLTVNGTTTTVNTTVIAVDDPVITLGGDVAPTSDDNKDRGIEFRYHNGTAAKVGFFGFDDSTGFWTFIPDATNTSEVFAGTKGTLDVTSITGSAATLTTARTISLSGDVTGSVSFDGSQNVTIAATIAANSVALGTDTTGDYVATVSAGTSGAQTGTSGLTITGTGEGAAVTIAHADTSNVTDLAGATNTFITAQTYDTYGHVLTRTTGTVDFTVAANHAFQNIAVAGQTTVVADSNTDTLTLVAGTNISITTNATNDSITISAADAAGDATATPNTVVARDANAESAFRGVILSSSTGTNGSTTTVASASHIDTSTSSFAATGAQTIYTYSGTAYKAAKIIIRAAQGTTQFQVTELLVVNDGAATPTVNHVEYGFVEVGASFAVTYNAVGATGNVVNITADAGATATTYTVQVIELS